MESVRVGVIGAGVVGLTTAVKIQQQLEGVQVTILAEKFSPDLTSNVAAGIFLWSVSAPDAATNREWAQDSWQWFSQLVGEPWRTGVSRLPAYVFSSHGKDQVERPLMQDLSPVYRDCTEKELHLPQPGGKYSHGKYMHTVQVDTELYLAWLMEMFIQQGGRVIQDRVESLDTLGTDCDIVVNCCGLGARVLCGDTAVVPMRGQVIRVSAPWIKTALYADDVYLVPGQKWVTVGGTRQYNDWMTEVSPHDSAKLWSRAVQAFPNLASAEVLGEVVGLRPHRHTPRVELEHLHCGLAVVHNYGHSGSGVVASPGTSQQAVGIVKRWLQGLQGTNSKL